ncbi:hypothetical protein RI129_007409 [Pyrocoelia pectoralis]|uniref:Gem-associated protein 8 n=1 Tax=Pyrocoelia pectoralis TaxID=417401 RepID=A0AAN7VHS1_9COLE
MEDHYCQNRLKTSRFPLYKSDIKFLVCRKFKRNRSRILRRKRSRLNYWKKLKLRKHNQSLCDTISVCSITDMDYQNEFHDLSVQPIPEVAEWHKQSQIAYWKSRALALELENNMLHKHIANIYANQIQEYVDYDDNDEYYDDRQQRRQNWSKKEEEHGSRQRKANSRRQQIWKAPEENSRKRKLEEMKTLYGEMAPKILGMETAIQLNYDLYLEKHNAKYWPNIPLRL